MVRRSVLAVLLFAFASFANAQRVVHLSDAVRHVVAPYSVAADEEQFYAATLTGVSRIARDGILRDADPVEQEDAVLGVAAGHRVVAVLTGTHTPAVTGFSRDGRILWKRTVDAPFRSPFFFDGTAFVHIGSSITRYDEATGDTLGAYDLRRDAYLVAAANSGENYVLLWSSLLDGLFAEFVEHDGDVLARVNFPRGTAASTGEPVALASNGEDAVAMWFYGGVQAMRFGPRGLIGGPVVLGTGGVTYDPAAVIWDGQRYRIAWSAADGIHAADLADGLAWASHVRLDDTGRPRLATAAGRTLLVSGKRNFVLEAGQSVSQIGASAGPSMTERGRDDIPAVAWTGDRYVAAWRHRAPDGTQSIRARFFAVDGMALGASFPVTTDTGDLKNISIAATSDMVLLAWGGLRPGARRFDVRGVMFDAQPLLLDSWYDPTASAGNDGFILFSTRIIGCTLLVQTFGVRDAAMGSPVQLLTSCPSTPWTSSLARPHVVWDGNAFAVRIDEIERPTIMDARIEHYLSSLLRVSPGGVATKLVQVGSWTYSTGLAVADGRYFVATDDAMLLVPFDLSTPRDVGDAITWSTHAFATGDAVIVLDGRVYRVFTSSGHFLGAHALPGAAAAGVGDGSGGALIACQNEDAIDATVLSHGPPKHRAVRP